MNHIKIKKVFFINKHRLVLLAFFFACKENFCILRYTLSIFQQRRGKSLYEFLLTQLVCILSLVNMMTSCFFNICNNTDF